MKHNLILDTDSYKQSHAQQYPPNTTKVYSYLESRGGEFDKTVFFGLQYILRQYLSIPISMKDIVEAEKVCKLHGVPFNKEGWLYILNVHGGRLPLRIKVVKEGSVIPVKNVLMTIENTDDKCFWLTNFMETLLLRVWYPITVASLSYNCKQIIKKYMGLTCENLDKLPFMLHDFGSRGVSSSESAGIGGLAHLVNFMGSDTMEAIRYAEYYYNEENPSFSIPATEHSTMTSWGRENESKAYKNVLDTYKGQMVSVVSDSYDIFNACSNIWGDELKQDVLTHGNYLVVRPDSGEPVTTPVKCIELLGKKFGYSINSKGFKVLNNVRVIQGDGISTTEVEQILQLMYDKRLSADNICFGMGGGLLQKVNRDTMKFAIKCSAIKINGEWKEVSKSPIGQEDKKSKSGLLLLTQHSGEYHTLCCKDEIEYNLNKSLHGDLLDVVFENGIIKREQNLRDIRTICNS